uniref:Uncharacterized protein n=1 Tax=Trichobilharzia regenti TaxID=157069 RepID=A0AA85KKN0_TRIRE|nr:unnamed protein product [Trichobilharzia regenti]
MAVSVVGLDVGTLTSYIGVARGGGIEVIANEYSERATPTCVAFSGNLTLVGTAAKLQHVMNYKNTFTNFTQLLGKSPTDFAVAKEKRHLTHAVECRDGRVSFPVVLNGVSTSFIPEQVLAIQLNKLKEITECAIGSKVVDVVINVPTYYTDAERRSVLDASKIAGLNCVKLVNDLTAVGTAYGFYSTDLPPVDRPPKVVCFVSVGYSTTQISICAFNTGKMKVLATVCDAFLGGRDFDRKLFDKFASDFQQQYKIKEPLSVKATIRLLQECEKLKKAMSANSSELPINVECLAEERDLANKMKRTDFEEMCSDLVQRFQDLLTRCLDTAKLKAEDVHSVELIGGSSRIPMLKNAILSVFKQEGRTSLNADEAVARGCAFQANLIQQDKMERERVNAKNAVEEYVYDIRSKIQGPLSPFLTPAESESLLRMLDATEEWLYGEGEEVTRQVYVEKLTELKSKSDPVVHRANEHLNRPMIVENFNRSIMHIKKVLDSLSAGEPTYDHLTPEQVSQLKEMIVQYEGWLHQQMTQQNSRPQTADPVVKVSEIMSQQKAFESTCHPIINTPKPAPPTQTDGPATQNSDQSNNMNNNTKEDNNPKTCHSNKNAKNEENMDLD